MQGCVIAAATTVTSTIVTPIKKKKKAAKGNVSMERKSNDEMCVSLNIYCSQKDALSQLHIAH